MKIFLDTANVEEIRTAKRWGVFKGLTTNPSIIAREEREFRDLAAELAELAAPYPVSLEAVARDAEGMAEQAHRLSELAPNVVVKLPTNPEGLTALSLVKDEGVKTNLTLVFSATQAMLAAVGGATYISPFIGRLEDRGYEGLKMLEQVMGMHNSYNLPSEVIAASVRDPHQVIEISKTGAHIVTLPFAVLEKMLLNTMTDADLEKFLGDWERVPGKENAFTGRLEKVVI